MRFRTRTGSEYVVNYTERTVSRVNGTSTDRVEAGRKFYACTAPKLGESVCIIWEDDTPLLPGSPDGAVAVTETSAVVEIFE